MLTIPMDEVGGLKIDPSVGRKLVDLPQDQRCLRVAVLGGGCSGFQYEIKIDDPQEDDDVFEGKGYKVCVDPVSRPFLEKACLIYRTDLTGSRFIVENPNAASSCGCGLSFSL